MSRGIMKSSSSVNNRYEGGEKRTIDGVDKEPLSRALLGSWAWLSWTWLLSSGRGVLCRVQVEQFKCN